MTASRRHSYQYYPLLLGGLAAAALFLLFFFVLGWSLYIAWLAAVNLVTFALFAADKTFAKADRARIPENVLHLFTLLGGFAGALAGRLVFHHKSNFSRHPAFLFVPLVSLLIWAAIGYFIFFK